MSHQDSKITRLLGEVRAEAVRLEGLTPDALLTDLAEQGRRLRFETIDLETAWEMGCLIRALGVRGGFAIAIDIALGGQTAFHAALPGTSADNDAWAARKAAVSDRYLESSLAVGVRFDAQPGGFDANSRLPVGQYAAHGGAIPLLLTTGAWVGHAVVSGLPAVSDHALVATVIADAIAVRPRP
jgi:uncharacterized protein (UPF0303 family)